MGPTRGPAVVIGIAGWNFPPRVARSMTNGPGVCPSAAPRWSRPC